MVSTEQSRLTALRKTFHPASIAVIGASADEQGPRSDGWLGRLIHAGFKGRLYPVNPRASQILGLRSYASVSEVPGSIDYAIIAVPAERVPAVLRECVAKRVAVVHVFSGDFADNGTETGWNRQQELEDIIAGGATRVIGPNCLGVYCPSGGLSFNLDFSLRPGAVSVVSQTGAALIRMLPMAHAKGIYFSKVVSYGNAIDIDSSELIEYLADDAETSCVMAYIEGVKDGRRLLDACARCGRTKPVIVLKAGLTDGGSRAISSHTATLVGTREVWQAFFRQSNAVSVETFDEALIQVHAFLNFARPAGRRVGIVGLGGGLSVVTADLCEKAGLEVPALRESTVRRLRQLKDLAVGRGIRNPVEMGLGKRGLFREFADGLEILASDENIDSLLIQLYPEGYVKHWAGGNQMDQAMDVLIDAVKRMQKPAAIVIGLGHDAETMRVALNAHTRCAESGLAIFSAPEAAARAVSKLIGYHEHRQA